MLHLYRGGSPELRGRNHSTALSAVPSRGLLTEHTTRCPFAGPQEAVAMETAHAGPPLRLHQYLSPSMLPN